MYAVIDIDGVLADNTHRLHHILNPDGSKRENADWNAFFAECEMDAPIEAGFSLLHALAQTLDITFLSGRSETSRAQTEQWLRQYGKVAPQRLCLRYPNDHRPDYIFKGTVLSDLHVNALDIALVVDDSLAVVNEAVRRGFTALHFRRPGEQKEWATSTRSPLLATEETP